MVGTGRLYVPDEVSVVLCHLRHGDRQRLGSSHATGLQAVERITGVNVREQGQVAPAQADQRMYAEQGRAVAADSRRDQIEDAARCLGGCAERPQGPYVSVRNEGLCRAGAHRWCGPARRRLSTVIVHPRPTG